MRPSLNALHPQITANLTGTGPSKYNCNHKTKFSENTVTKLIYRVVIVVVVVYLYIIVVVATIVVVVIVAVVSC